MDSQVARASPSQELPELISKVTIEDATVWPDNFEPEPEVIQFFRDLLSQAKQDARGSKIDTDFLEGYIERRSLSIEKECRRIEFPYQDRLWDHNAEDTIEYYRKVQIRGLSAWCRLCEKMPATWLMALLDGDKSVRQALGEHYRDLKFHHLEKACYGEAYIRLGTVRRERGQDGVDELIKVHVEWEKAEKQKARARQRAMGIFF